MPADDEASFDDLPLTERAREAAHALGWRAPTPIQRAVIPPFAAGKDVIGRAETGSGKTGAFGLVLTDAVKAPGLKALVLAPTRELAQQIAADLNDLARGAPFRAVAVHGGVPHDEQVAALRDPATTCVVATTGRLLDLLGRKQCDLSAVGVVVIDEADRMLDLGFLPEVERVLGHVPKARQVALFTATMPKKVAALARTYMARPREVEVGAATPQNARHFRVDVPSFRKGEALVALLREEEPARALVFTRTREGARDVARLLREAGLPALELTGSLEQAQREDVLAALKDGRARIVVATDVASRGLHVDGVTHVVNHDVPEEADAYVHRAGRTARAGKGGRVFTLVTENDAGHVAAAEAAAAVRLRPHELAGAEWPAAGPEGAAAPHAPRPPPRGGNASGARPKGTPTPPRPVKPDDVDEPAAPRRDPEHRLPPSRRRRT